MEKCSALHIGGISILYPTNPNQNSSYLGGGDKIEKSTIDAIVKANLNTEIKVEEFTKRF